MSHIYRTFYHRSFSFLFFFYFFFSLQDAREFVAHVYICFALLCFVSFSNLRHWADWISVTELMSLNLSIYLSHRINAVFVYVKYMRNSLHCSWEKCVCFQMLDTYEISIECIDANGKSHNKFCVSLSSFENTQKSHKIPCPLQFPIQNDHTMHRKTK